MFTNHQPQFKIKLVSVLCAVSVTFLSRSYVGFYLSCTGLSDSGKIGAVFVATKVFSGYFALNESKHVEAPFLGRHSYLT